MDLSLLGAGLLFAVEEGCIHEGQRLIVWVHAPIGDSVSLRLVGRVRNVGQTDSGHSRVGLEFVDLSETEQAILRVFEVMKVFW